MDFFKSIKLYEFLRSQPKMKIQTAISDALIIKGDYSFKARRDREGIAIEDSYKLVIILNKQFPRELPIVKELGEKIPRNNDFHISSDGSLCLTSPLRILLSLNENPNLIHFSNVFIRPFLFSISCKLRYGADFMFGELDHGSEGLIEDYSDILGLSTKDQVIKAFELLGMKKRAANKRNCPCGCGKRLGKCSFRKKINNLRKKASNSWFRNHLNKLN